MSADADRFVLHPKGGRPVMIQVTSSARSAFRKGASVAGPAQLADVRASAFGGGLDSGDAIAEELDRLGMREVLEPGRALVGGVGPFAEKVPGTICDEGGRIPDGREAVEGQDGFRRINLVETVGRALDGCAAASDARVRVSAGADCLPMDMAARPRGILVGMLALFLGLSACGSGESSTSSDGGALASGAGLLSWLDHETKYSTQFASGARVISPMLDMVQISGGEPSGIGISFGVSMPPPLLPGSYPCGVSGNRIIASFSYTPGSPVQSCVVDLSRIGKKTGERVTGTFVATVGTSVIGGIFDVGLTVTAL